MDRRAFLKTSVAVGAASLTWPARGSSEWRTYEVATKVELAFPKGVSRVWLPLPMRADTEWHRSLGNEWSGNASRAEVVSDGKYGVPILYAEWDQDKVVPQLEVKSRVATREHNVDPSKPRPRAEQLSAADRQFFTAATDYIPTDGIVRKTAQGIVKGAGGEVSKARAIYEWVVENTFRDPKVRGCGRGDIRSMLETGNLGGKCADLNALYVGLARASGLPARDVYGIRTVKSELGYKSLGPATPIITKAQHCRAEVYLSAFGWVPVDPADVRKVALEEPPGNRPLDDEMVKSARARLFGSWEGNWIAYNFGHDVSLPGAESGPLEFLMYPQAETARGRVDSLDPDGFKYEITAREIVAAAS